MKDILRKVPLLWIGGAGCFILLFLFIFGPYLPMVHKNVPEHLYITNKDPLDFEVPPYSPGSRFPLGSDIYGRDMLSALVVGTRETMILIASITGFTFLIAVPLGIVAAHSRFFKILMQGWTNLFSRMPPFFYLLLLISIPVFIYSPSQTTWMIFFLILMEVGKVADVVHKGVILVQETTYYDAAIVSGTKLFGLAKRYYWPSCFPQWAAYFVQHLGGMLFLMGQLGFFNIYFAKDSLYWPIFLHEITYYLYESPWVPIYTCLFISFAIFSFLALGKGILQYHLMLQRGNIYRKEKKDTLLQESPEILPVENHG